MAGDKIERGAEKVAAIGNGSMEEGQKWVEGNLR